MLPFNIETNKKCPNCSTPLYYKRRWNHSGGHEVYLILKCGNCGAVVEQDDEKKINAIEVKR